MRKHVLIREMMFIGLSALSIVAYAYSFSDAGSSDGGETQPLENKIAEVPEAAVQIPADALAYTAPKSAPTEKPQSQHPDASVDRDDEESCLLAEIAMAEAGSEDVEGKALVMRVVLNRVGSEDFPDTIEEVIYQPGQFSPISNGHFGSVEPDADCWTALDMIMLDEWDESCGATYFESESKSTWHSDNLDFLFRHGNHYFYKDRG